MMMRFFPALVLLLTFARAGNAQTLDLDSLKDRLGNEKDIPTLRAREFSLARASATSNDALLERAMVLLRLHQLSGDDDDAKHSRDLFDRATKKMPGDARPYYGRGLARLGGPNVRIPSPAGVLKGVVTAQSFAEIAKRDPVSLAKKDFKKAIELDPNFVSPAIQLAHVSLDTRDKDHMEAAAVALRRHVADKRGGSGAAVTLSELEDALGNTTAAASAAETATTLATGTVKTSSAAHARAVSLMRQPGKQEEAARAYFAGLDELTDESAQAYYDAVIPIATEREQFDWQRGDLAARKEWLKRFWNVRAAASGVTVGERMAEHFKRLAAAHDKYRRQGKRGSAPGGSLVLAKYQDDALPFDDRGIIYVRHGAPAEIVHTSDVDLRPNETWVYHSNGKDQLYNFVVLRDGTDYRLVDDVLAALDPTTRGLPAEAAARLLRDRQAYEPRYAALAQKFDNYERAARFRPNDAQSAERMDESAGSISTAQTRIAADMRAQALIALATDSDAPDFKSDLPFYYDLYAFKGKNGMTDVTAAAAIPGNSLFAQPMGTQFLYSIQASLIFIDTVTSEITRKDSAFTYLSSKILGEFEHLRLTIDLPVPHAKAGVHRIVLRDRINSGVGQLYGGTSDLKNFNGTQLMLSDVVLAESEDGAWQRGAARLGLVPPRQFAENRPLKLFYEVYNLGENTPYRTEILLAPVQGTTGFGRIKKLFGGSDGKIQLQFDGVSPATSDGTLQELKQVTARVRPGKYKVTVRVTNLENQQSVRSETLFLVSPKPKK